MLSYNIVRDSDIMAINRSKQENASDSIVYRDTSGVLHTIDLEVCAKNYSEITGLNNNLVGERKIDEHYVLLYTSGVPTKIIFSKFFIFHPTDYIGLCGSRNRRFLSLIKLLDETKFRTRDLS